MATYFHNGNSEIQGNDSDGLQTLILMNPASYNNLGYNNNSDNTAQPPQPQTNNFVFLNNHPHPHPHAPNANHPHAQPSHFIGIPQDFSALHGFHPRVHYNPTLNTAEAREPTRAPQGLSLTLSSQQQTPRYNNNNNGMPPQSQPISSDDVRGSPSVSGVSNGVNGVLSGSKYLKAVQELLDEVVNVGKGGESSSIMGGNGQSKNIGESGVEGNVKGGRELTTAERQEIQMKKAKLVNMLDEVEQRYRQYHHQMQIVISWFEQAAGIGSAKTYTALALQTISKQFRCLKDAILGQIRTASKSLGEEESSGGKVEGSRLKYVDNQIRQQRALQQLGMIQHNAWRPQRGLPERSVSVLRAWLFEHFLHPYPKDSDKIMLAKQTGLTRSQVSNWFINARVRLWKPMVEEMYREETKELEKNGSEDKTSKNEQNEDSTSKSTAPTTENQNTSFVLEQNNPINQNTSSAVSLSRNSKSPNGTNINAGFNLIGLSEMESITQGSPKKQRGVEILHSQSGIPSMNMDSKPPNAENDHHMSMKYGDERQGRDVFTFMGAPTNFINGFGSYPIAELERFETNQFQAPYSGNGVSLTLGLPHCENLSMPGSHQNFLPNQNIQLGRELDIGEANDFSGMDTPTSTRPMNMYEGINIQNRKRFAAQLLPDFVA